MPPRRRLETQKTMWNGQKMGAGNGKAAEEAARVTNNVCIPQGKRSHSREGMGACRTTCVLPPGCAARHGLAVPQQGGGDTPAPGGPQLQSTVLCAAVGT